jgi:tetratricopeptide (TPR) repeat protein
VRLALAALVLSVALRASADEAADQARANFQKGQAEYNLGNYAEAAKYFEETYRHKPVPALLFNIAQCYRFVGNLEKAVQTYRAYLRTAPEGDKNLELAQELLEQVETALASKKKAESSPPHGLVPAPPASAAGQPTAPAAQPSATAVQSSAAAPAPAAVPASSRPAEQTVAAATPAASTPVTPVPPAAAPATETAAAPAPSSHGRVYTWVAAGASVVALGGGAMFGLKSKSAISDLQSGYHPTATIDSQTASAKSDASKATVLLVAGAALAVATGVFFALEF